mmetsp:Transcript_4484/g.15549  ORF Transcript_4484/g.15549 Transcript_4484/m.15549 type:complete len:87 (+) Transcript_4484:244-504(+)
MLEKRYTDQIVRGPHRLEANVSSASAPNNEPASEVTAPITRKSRSGAATHTTSRRPVCVCSQNGKFSHGAALSALQWFANKSVACV